MLELLTDPQAWLSLLTLACLEVVLGIDNIIFLSILSSRLPAREQPGARRMGLVLALGTRLALLGCLSFLVHLTTPLVKFATVSLSGKDLVLLVGGLFLLVKATKELHHRVEETRGLSPEEDREQSVASGTGPGPASTGPTSKVPTVRGVVIQMALLDIVFSLDSVITAVGMTPHLSLMVGANIIALFVMLLASGGISRFIDRHPTVKVLALSFLLLVGFLLVGEALGIHVPKGYLYFAMAFSFGVEMFNIRTSGRKRKSAPI